MENAYLRITFLPEVGGRLYQCLFKPTGNNEFYQNPVLKPTHWGPTEPEGANWWLAAGGLEWGFPIEEHGYTWGVPWQVQMGRDKNGRWTMMRYAPAGQLQATVTVSLLAGEAAFHINVALHNPTGRPLTYKFWDNAMLAPGRGNAPSSGLQFIIPAQQMEVHSTSAPGLPGPGGIISWPLYQGHDLSYPVNWGGWLGVFARPVLANWAAVYDHEAEEGIVRVFPREQMHGVKAFSFGGAISPDNWTDDGSSYVELHSGVAQTFNDTATLPSGSTFSWRECWYPVAGSSGMINATSLGTVNFWQQGDALALRLATTRELTGKLTVALNGTTFFTRNDITISPGPALALAIPLPASRPASGKITITFATTAGTIAGQTTLNFR